MQSFSDIFGDLTAFYKIITFTNNKKLIKETKQKIILLLEKIERIEFFDFENTTNEFNALFDIIGKIEQKKHNANYHNRCIAIMQRVYENKENLDIFGDRYLKGGLLLSFLLMNIIFIIGLFIILKNPFTFILLFFLVFISLLISITIYDLDRFKFGEQSIKIRNIEDLKKLVETE